MSRATLDAGARVHAIKFRERAKGGRWYFATPTGAATWLRIYASRYDSAIAAQAAVDRDAPANPELEFKVVAL